MQKKFARTDRVSSSIQKELTNILIRDFSSLGVITIVRVQLTADLSVAHIYFTHISTNTDDDFFEKSKNHQIEQKLNALSYKIRYHLANKVRMRRIPNLKFYYDENSSHGSRLNEIISNAIRIDNSRY